MSDHTDVVALTKKTAALSKHEKELYDALFDLVVKLTRDGKTSYPDIISQVEQRALGKDILWVRTLVSAAQKFVTDLHTLAFDASVQLFRSGAEWREVTSKLEQLGYHSFDSQMVAARAKAKAAEEK
jgi:hypothetical protein